MSSSVPLRRRHVLAGSLAGLAGAALGPARRAGAQAIAGTAEIIVGYPAGGATDTTGRFLAEAMRGSYAPAVIVENRPGAGSQAAAVYVKNSAGDGARMLMAPSPVMVTYPHVYQKLGYDPLRDFTPVTTICTFPHLISVGPAVPAEVRTVPELVAWVRADPSRGTYGTAGAGSVPHFLGVAFARAAGVPLTHVPYKGDAPAIQDLLGGQIPMVVGTLGSALPHVQAGKLRALATSGPRRTQHLPDVPTVREAGFARLELLDWFGIFVPAATPADRVATLYASVREALGSARLKEGFAKLAFEPGGETPASFAAAMRADYDRWGPIVKESGFKPET